MILVLLFIFLLMGVKLGRRQGITREIRGGKQHWRPSDPQSQEVRLFTIGSLSFIFFPHATEIPEILGRLVHVS